MDLKQLRYFVAVARELHFGRAARRLHISQPALSFDIKKFEQQLGVTLLERNSKRVALTDAGTLLLTEAEHLLAHAADAEQLVRRSAQRLSGRLRVGFVNSMLFRGLPEAIERFGRDHADIDIVLKELNSEEQTAALLGQRIDMGCAHGIRHSDEIRSQLLLRESFLCCLPRSHRLASTGPLELTCLADEPFILFPRAVSPHYHDRIVALCVEAGFSPQIRHEARLWQTVVTMVEKGMGIALVPAPLVHAARDAACFRPLAGNAGMSEIHLLRRSGIQNPLADAFSACLAEAT
ncbi:LysR family transcriptional regulator [Salinisphaera sp.]|uniref:LysR family transcriptional regulator n=1 Tax=Salinisphaera sp. TaxID=1914330 RepID=UPI000C60479F|nr:LysR family transcriptional regulator [Salinisphaera sp.]MBS62530.1 LysR family transcriptional regulator [Salinisphaera sp.]